MNARSFIQPGEQVITIFTRGGRFEVHDDHSGYTGNWRINPQRRVDRVIIYHRDETLGSNTLYIGNLAKIVETHEENRYGLFLEHVQYIGTTHLDWKDFADTGQNPIRYLP